MSNLESEEKLYLVLLGGRTKNSNIEQHDIRWVVGHRIEDTFKQLRKEWFGLQSSLHIDSYIHIKYIDGYEIILCKDNNNQQCKNRINRENHFEANKYLWFVNLGGYESSQMYELHECKLLVTDSKSNAKKLALNSSAIKDKKHKDDIYNIKSSFSIDDLKPITKVQEWHVMLVKDSLHRCQVLKPDWYGFYPINKHSQLSFSPNLLYK
tara:strand:+ start:483 stop:1109 length:627 start_codon:yes stop_codon:yes gene_type:complete